MSLDDDFWVLSMVTSGPWSILFAVLFVVATCWQCHRESACKAKGGVYLWESTTCVKPETIIEE